MMKHVRIYCRECKRERLDPKKYFVNSAPLTITGNKRDDLCIYCGSGEIETVEYEPQFLGGDIPRGKELVIPIEADKGEDYNPETVPQRAPGFISNELIKTLY